MRYKQKHIKKSSTDSLRACNRCCRSLEAERRSASAQPT